MGMILDLVIGAVLAAVLLLPHFALAKLGIRDSLPKN